MVNTSADFIHAGKSHTFSEGQPVRLQKSNGTIFVRQRLTDTIQVSASCLIANIFQKHWAEPVEEIPQWSNVCRQVAHEKVICFPSLFFHCQTSSCHKHGRLLCRILLYAGFTYFLSLAIWFCDLCL